MFQNLQYNFTFVVNIAIFILYSCLYILKSHFFLPNTETDNLVNLFNYHHIFPVQIHTHKKKNLNFVLIHKAVLLAALRILLELIQG